MRELGLGKASFKRTPFGVSGVMLVGSTASTTLTFCVFRPKALTKYEAVFEIGPPTLLAGYTSSRVVPPSAGSDCAR